MSRFPKFNRGVFLENKAKVGTVDEILGPLNGFYFSVKPAQGVDPKSFKSGQVLYMNPEDLLSTDRFTKPQAPRPKGAPGQGGFRGGPQQRGGFNNRGGSGGFNNRGGSGGFNRGGSGGFNRGGARPSFNNRGGARS
jgi:H/ACA ribonucleoprotein complex subunit 1